MDDIERRCVIDQARATVDRLDRQERSEVITEARSRVSDWTPPAQEPERPAQKLDTAVTANQVRQTRSDLRGGQ
jgi:hypothetical protein